MTSCPPQQTIQINTKVMDDEYESVKKKQSVKTISTPDTSPSSISSSSSRKKSVRGKVDIRSPGAAITPSTKQSKFRFDEGKIPDFITQTDRYGNSLLEDKRDDNSPRSVEDHCDSLLETIRTMCCCMMVESNEKPMKEEEHCKKLLPKIHTQDVGKKCLVLDLDETLVHSSFRAVPDADFVIPVQIEEVVHFVYVTKRPGVDEFLFEMSKHYEIVVYTASLNKYADPLLDLLDTHQVIRARLFRESCVYHEGNFVKDLSLLDRDLSQTIIVDNSPASYLFQPENAIDCSSFIDDLTDRELDQIHSFLTGIKDVNDVRFVCHTWRSWVQDQAR